MNDTKILIIGSGGREHALGWKLLQSSISPRLFFAPGNAGTARIGTNIDIAVEKLDELVGLVKDHHISLTIVGPEVPLELGIVDLFESKGLRIFGPRKQAARLETSKAWAADFVQKHGIPHPRSATFSDFNQAKDYIASLKTEKVVVKASGLAAGKGVVVAESKKEAATVLQEMLSGSQFGNAGRQVVFQEFLEGFETSLLAFTDGETIVPLLPAQDHKQVFDGDRGPNTGGMGVYAPLPLVDSTLKKRIYDEILVPTIAGLRDEGIVYKGLLYAGLMITQDGPKVIEYNARFGDPETQPLMMLLASDLYSIINNCIDGKLRPEDVRFYQGFATSVVLTSDGYPGDYKKGEVIHGLDKVMISDVQVFHSGTKQENGHVVSNGGRVLTVTSFGNTLEESLSRAYGNISTDYVHFNCMHYRRDIGRRDTFVAPLKQHRIEVASQIEDSRARQLQEHLITNGFSSMHSLVWHDVYTITKDFDLEILQHISSLLSNPVTQKASIDVSDFSLPFDWAIQVRFLPGVTDNVGHTAQEIIQENLHTLFENNEHVHSSKVIFVSGTFTREDIVHLADQLYNPLIQEALIMTSEQYQQGTFSFRAEPSELHTIIQEPQDVNLHISDDELEDLSRFGIRNTDGSRRGPLSLRLSYLKAIRNYFDKLDRNPTDIEIESLAQTWSEHCKHTIFSDPIDELSEGLYKTYIQGATKQIRSQRGDKDICVSVFSDNAGAIIFNDDYLVTHKVETHNSPSALDPFGGAVTGIVGVNRDTIGFGLGAKPVINTYGFCVASPFVDIPLYRDRELTQKMLSPRRILEGVVGGVNAGGNCSGIPTPQGFVYFDESYRGKPLVFAGTVGLLPRKINGNPSHEKKARKGDLIVMVGGRVGLDGIHGATFSSGRLVAHSPSTAVQIGDPITQKKFSDALIKEARDLSLFSSITDNGAGGLSCSVGEMAKESGGAVVDLEKVPLKYPGLEPWQIWISESQERMTLAVPPEYWPYLAELLKRRGVEATVIGEFTDSGKCEVRWHGATIMDVSLDFMHNGLPPEKQLTQLELPKQKTLSFDEPTDYNRFAFDFISRLNLASYSFISTQYDHEVQAGSILKPLQGSGRINADATVTRPVLTSPRGVVLSQALYPHLTEIDPYAMAANSIDTAIRNVVVSGADPDHVALLDNFCWSSSTDPKRLGLLKEASRACYDTAVTFGTPFISGKDSMFNDATYFDSERNEVHISALPTLLISSMGIIPNCTNSVSLDFKYEGDLVYLLGETQGELGGSEYLLNLKEQGILDTVSGHVPQVNAQHNKVLYEAYYHAVHQGIIASGQSVHRGGLLTALLKSALAGQYGFELKLPEVDMRTDHYLFNESPGRILVTINPKDKDIFESIFHDFSTTFLGVVSKKKIVFAQDSHRRIILDLSLASLEKSYRLPFADF